MKLGHPLRLILLLLVVVAAFYVIFAAIWVPTSNQPGPAAENPYLRYLPTVIRENSTNTAPTMTRATTEEDEIALANIATLPDAEGDSIIDTTEDYKALGYTDSRKIVRDEEGDLYVAYRKKWQGQYRIFVAKSTNQGKSWTILNGKKPIESVGNYTQRVPSLAIGRTEDERSNFLHLVWYGNDGEHPGNERQIKYLRLTTTGKLSADDCCATAVNIAGYNGQALWQEHPTLYVNGSNVYITWEGRDAASKNAKIKFLRSTDFGETWTPPSDIARSDSIHFSRPTLAVTYAGEQRQLYVVAYGEHNGLSQIYWTRSLDNGDTWAEWELVAADEADQRHVSLARDKTDKLHVVWRQTTDEGSRTILRYRVYNPALQKGAGGWATAAQTIASHTDHCLFFPSVAVGSDDRVWVVWTQSSNCLTIPSDSPTEGQIVYRIRSAAGQWSNPVTLTNDGAHIYASLRNAHTPNREAMDLIWLDVSQCMSEQPAPEQERANEEADVAASTTCVIRYTSVE